MLIIIIIVIIILSLFFISFENDARPTHFSNIVCTDSSLLVLQQCSYSEIIGQCTDSDDVSVTCCKLIYTVGVSLISIITLKLHHSTHPTSHL